MSAEKRKAWIARIASANTLDELVAAHDDVLRDGTGLTTAEGRVVNLMFQTRIREVSTPEAMRDRVRESHGEEAMRPWH